jgi:predicted alpha/beta-fold hydrolase
VRQVPDLPESLNGRSGTCPTICKIVHLPPFEPFFRNPHLATIAGNFWSRPRLDERWPPQAVHHATEPGVKVLVVSHQPDSTPKGELVLVHGLEGSSDAGYQRSMAAEALKRGFAVHRFNMRSCGGTDHLAPTAYHAGQTSDVLAFLRARKQAGAGPIFLIGFSLGGNVVLKLAGESAEEASTLLAGVCGVSTPIDLGVCAHAIGRRKNFIYQRRFLAALKNRIRRRHLQAPEIYTLEHLAKVRSIVDFDNFYTARLFGFGTAANYFRTQSCGQFLDRIRIPALLITAQDDPLVPFEIYSHPAFSTNPNLHLITPDHGGHLGFLSRRNPRFWLDGVVLDWIESL